MKNDELFALVEKAIDGDRVAFEALYSAQIKTIIYGVRNWLYDKNGVDDAASEVVLHMFNSISRLSSPYAFKAWMQKIIFNTCAGLNKKTKRDSGLDITDYEAVLVDDDVDVVPETLVMSGDEDSDVNAAIQALPPSQRRTLILFYYEDMGYQEIAEALGVSESSVSTNLIKARKNLRGILEMKGITYPDLMESERKSGFGLAVSSAIGADISKTISSSQIDTVLNACGGKIAAVSAPATASATSSISHSLINAVKSLAQVVTAKTIVLGVACAVIITSGVAFTLIINKAEIPLDKEIAEQTFAPIKVYEPDVVIEFSGSTDSATDSAEHINPTSAKLSDVGSGDTVSGWFIYDGENNIVSSGQGTVVENAFENLVPGNYRVTWILTTQAGERARAFRDFTVK
jgi:RNA polymerase sigma-70 factor (ECF subfamily)